MLSESLTTSIEVLTVLFGLGLVIALAMLAVIYFVDAAQSKDAIRHNFPVIGRFRTLFIYLGEFFRQYFFAMDREEMPFNRAERNWVYRAAKNEENIVAFGSSRNLKEVGCVIFVNCPFPTQEAESAPSRPLLIGPHCDNPYLARSLFNISGMSFGALSVPAVRALSQGARMAECWLNTGEGGMSSHHLEGGCDLVFQIGTANYGVRRPDGTLSEARLREVAAHPEVKMFEVKLSQGAKPGKGGILPGAKVTPEIAAIRGIETWKDSISPNRHPEINSVKELLDFIDGVRRATGKPVGFKCVVGAYGWLEAMCREILARGDESAPDFITLDSADGGSGAAPMPLMDNVGLLIRESLPLVADLLKKYGLKQRIRLVASGKLTTPAEAAWALCAGADFVISARGFMFALGCIQAMRCNKNTCPTGVTTHNPRLQQGLDPADKAVKVANYCRNMVHEVETIAHSCGVPEPRRLRRFHVRIVQPHGISKPMNELFPTDDPTDSDPAAARAAAEGGNLHESAESDSCSDDSGDCRNP